MKRNLFLLAGVILVAAVVSVTLQWLARPAGIDDATARRQIEEATPAPIPEEVLARMSVMLLVAPAMT